MWKYIPSDELMHYGILGMKWGVRKTQPSRHTTHIAKKDAKRYADAKMFYGKTAGTKRKLLKAELDKKKQSIDGYEKAFNEAVENMDYSKSAKKAVVKRKTKDTIYRTRITVKQFLGVTGPLSVAAGIAIYHRNKDKIDAFVAKKIQEVIYK